MAFEVKKCFLQNVFDHNSFKLDFEQNKSFFLAIWKEGTLFDL